MIQVDLYYNKNILYRFKLSGHAGYADHGQDIVCSAVSILVINTLNALEALTNEECALNEMDSDSGVIDCTFSKRKQGMPNKEATLLIEAMLMGLRSVKQMYGEYIVIK
ncbi:MAG: ribosomal-processing cysteine protease Prp, partial [Niameybacter sp.]